jgi:hypothetical protein
VNGSKANLQNWAATAEIISAIAVVVSLLYVGIGLRENTKAIEGTTYQQMVRASNEYLLAAAADSGLAEILTRTWSDSSHLTPVEWVRAIYYERVLWRNMENAYFQHERGVLDDQGWEVYSRIACKSRIQRSWRMHTPALSAEFVKFIETCSE